MGSPYDPGAWRRWVNWKAETPPDPGPSATDRGSGADFSIAPPHRTYTLAPEVLAQLQRIEDHLVGLRKTLKSDSLPPGLGPQ